METQENVNRFVDNETLLNAETLNQMERELKSYANTAGKLYLHKVHVTQGSDKNCMYGSIILYTRSSAAINNVGDLASALGIEAACDIPISGCRGYVSTELYYNMTLSATLSKSAITLRGCRIGYSDASTGIIDYMDGSGNVVITDSVSQV